MPINSSPETATTVQPKIVRTTLLWLAAICAVGLALRLGLFFAIWANGGNPLLGDEGNYVEAALSLASGAGIPDNWLWIRPPGFIIVAAGVFKLTGDSLVALNLVQIAFSVASIVLIFMLARTGMLAAGVRQQIAERSGLVAAAILALNPSLILASVFFLSETLFLLLLIALTLLVVMALSGARRPLLLLAVAGLIGGMSLLVRANSITFLGPLGLLILFRLPAAPKLRFAGAALFGVCVLLVLAPWTVRNVLHYDRLLLLETTGQYNLYLDNNDLGRKEVDAQLWQVENSADRGNVAGAAAFRWISTHPGDFASRVARRLIASVAPDDFTEAGYPMRDKIPGSEPLGHDLFSLGATLGYLLLVGFALAGLLAAPRGLIWLITVIYCAAYILTAGLTHNEFRFRLQLFPFLAIFAAYLLVQPGIFFKDPARQSNLRRVVVAAVLSVAMLWIAFGLPNIIQGVGKAMDTAGLLASSSGSGTAALEAARQAGELNWTSSAVWRRYGILLAEAGRSEESADAFGHALDFEPGDYQTRAIYAAQLRETDPTGAAKMVAGVPPTFNLALQRWSWDNLSIAPSTSLDVGGDDLGLVQGFFPAEADASGFTYRWAGDWAQVRLLRSAAASKLRFTARSLPLASGAGREVSILANGTVVTKLTLAPGWQDYELDLPGQQEGPLVVRWEMKAERASPDDSRQLSIAIDKVSLTAP